MSIITVPEFECPVCRVIVTTVETKGNNVPQVGDLYYCSECLGHLIIVPDGVKAASYM